MIPPRAHTLMLNRFAAVVLAMCSAWNTAAQTLITLKPVARIPAGHALTLGDVAVIRGDSESLALFAFDTASVPAPAMGTSIVVTTDAVWALVDDAGVSRSTVNLRGSRCEVLVRPASSHSSVNTGVPVTRTSAEKQATNAGPTLMHHIRHRLEQALDVAGDDLEITTDPIDEALLSTPTLGWTVEVRLTGFSRRTPLRITMYSASGAVRDEAIRVGLRTKRDIARSKRTLDRGSVIGLDDLTAERIWLAPDAHPVSIDEAVGLVIRSRLDAGEMLDRGSVESPIAIEKGDIVIVHVVSQSIVLRREARALTDGRVGDTIELQPLTGGRERFTARVDSPGRAVVLVRPDDRTLGPNRVPSDEGDIA